MSTSILEASVLPLNFIKLLLEKECQTLKNSIFEGKMGETSVMPDWNRAYDRIFIGECSKVKSIKAIRFDDSNKKINDEEKLFKSIDELSLFIEKHLLHKEEDKDLKKYYLALILYSFHQGGFPNLCASLILNINHHYNYENGCIKEGGFLLSQPSSNLFITPIEGGSGLRLKQIHTYVTIKNSEGVKIKPDAGQDHLVIESDMTIRISAKNLEIIINEAKLDLHSDLAKKEFSEERLQAFFYKNFKKKSLSFMDTIVIQLKRLFNITEINKNWLRKAEKNGNFQTIGSIHEGEELILTLASQKMEAGNSAIWTSPSGCFFKDEKSDASKVSISHASAKHKLKIK